MPVKNTYSQQLQATAQAFSSRLKSKIEEIETAWNHVLSTKQDTESRTNSLQFISDIVHELHGQGELFGYPEISKAAGALEELMELILKGDIEFKRRLSLKVNALLDNLRNTASTPDLFEETLFNNKEAITAIGDYKKSSSTNESKKILIIEDTNVTRQHIAASLRLAGFDVLEAADGTSGIHLAIQNTPDLILLDIKMPGVDGFEVQQKVRTHDDLCGVPIVFLTSLNRVSIDQIKRSLSYGVSDYISKPFTMSRLIEKVKDNLV